MSFGLVRRETRQSFFRNYSGGTIELLHNSYGAFCQNNIVNVLPMTLKQIKEALDKGYVVVLSDTPHLCIVPDLFGELVVVSILTEEEPVPVRLAAKEDIKQAIIYEKKQP